MREEKDERPVKFLKSENGRENSYHGSAASGDVRKRNVSEPSGNSGIKVSNVTAKWTEAQAHNSLEDINLTVKSGRLVAIIGPTGAGKV